jgi:hypothetical protein
LESKGAVLRKQYLCYLFAFLSVNSWSGPKEQAWKLHNRLTGVPPVKRGATDPLNDMEALIKAGRAEDAARIAMNNPNFYNIVLKNWIKPWTNRDQSPRVEFNDYVATVIGLIRDSDEIPFTEVLHGDILYTVNYNNTDGTPSVYSPTNNTHYLNAENRNIDLKANLRRRTQSALTEIPSAAVAGVLTTRAAGDAFYSAGTNRRVNLYTFMNYLCREYEELHDVNVPAIRVRRDVERNPGGDSRTYLSKCVGCHAGQDALGGAYAHYDFVGDRLVYTPNVVVSKMNHNVYFKDGYVTTDDSWINTWAQGQNASLGWRGATQGRGVKELGQMFSRSSAFSQCMAKKVFKLVCLKEAINTSDVNMVKDLAGKFEQTNYNMKELIVNTSVGCVLNEDQ